MFSFGQKNKNSSEGEVEKEKAAPEGEEKNENGKTEEKDLIIHTMPDNYRFYNVVKSSNSLGYLILFAGIVLMAVSGYALYYFMFGPGNQEKTAKAPVETEAKPEDQASSTEEIALGEAKEAYLAINRDFFNVIDWTDFEKYAAKNLSQGRIAEIQAETEVLAALTLEQKDFLVEAMKQGVPREEDIVDIGVSDGADGRKILNILADSDHSGTAEMALENNVWKLDKEEWPRAENQGAFNELVAMVASSSTETAVASGTEETATTTPIAETLDTDTDGITDKEEELLGTDIAKLDSDGDGYGDLVELENGYSPVGSEKIFETTLFRAYSNDALGYKTYYPFSWTAAKLDGDNSVILRAADNQFFQVLVQKNPEHKTAAEWYQDQFGVTKIDPQAIVKGTNWEGVVAPDNLNIYLTEENADNLYVLSYNLAGNTQKYYPNFFRFFVKNFAFFAN